MSYRPYFKHGIEQIQEIVASSHGDLKTLKVIQYELRFRDRPKARALKAEVDELVRRLSVGVAVPPARTPPPRLPARPTAPTPPSLPPSPPSNTAPMPPEVQPPSVVPDRVVVECANCKTSNFVSTLDGVIQHLSCSACKSPYEALFKYGVMRTRFQAKPSAESSGSGMKWILIGLIVLVVIVLMAK